jgi:hypothetical protein
VLIQKKAKAWEGDWDKWEIKDWIKWIEDMLVLMIRIHEAGQTW